MRKSLVSLLIAIFFLVLLVFVSSQYSPFDDSGLQSIIQRYGITESDEFREIVSRSVDLGVVWEFLNFKVIIAWSMALAGVVVSFIVSLHLAIDKLFFKQLFEQPNLLTAMRRGILVFFVIYMFLGLHLLGAFVWYTASITILLLGIFEIGVVYLRRGKDVIRDRFNEASRCYNQNMYTPPDFHYYLVRFHIFHQFHLRYLMLIVEINSNVPRF